MTATDVGARAAQALVAIAVTVIVYALAERVARRVRSTLANPVLVAIAVMSVLVRLSGRRTTDYVADTHALSLLLGPAVVALGAMLHAHAAVLRARARRIAAAITVGSMVGVISAVVVAKLMGAPRSIVATLAPKSVTTPIAMAITEHTGGSPPLAAAIVIAVGILGAVVGPPLLRLVKVEDKTAWGLAMGAAAHGVGTARAVEEGPEHGAASALAICLMGIATAIVAPLVMLLV